MILVCTLGADKEEMSVVNSLLQLETHYKFKLSLPWQTNILLYEI
jgi:hypothetical protein